MTVDEIRELINLAAETGVAELEVQRGDNRVRIRRAGFATQDVVIGAPVYPPYPRPLRLPLPRPMPPSRPGRKARSPTTPTSSW